jgi:hypothetical protein
MEPTTPESPTSKKKTGNKPKQLVEGTYQGIEVGRGENKKIIDPKEVQKLASIGMKNSEIAEYLDIDDSTLNYNFKQYLTKGKHDLKVSLRRAQISLALSGNATMLVWLGKNILGQSDSPLDSDANQPLPWTDD